MMTEYRFKINNSLLRHDIGKRTSGGASAHRDLSRDINIEVLEVVFEMLRDIQSISTYILGILLAMQTCLIYLYSSEKFQIKTNLRLTLCFITTMSHKCL